MHIFCTYSMVKIFKSLWRIHFLKYNILANFQLCCLCRQFCTNHLNISQCECISSYCIFGLSLTYSIVLKQLKQFLMTFLTVLLESFFFVIYLAINFFYSHLRLRIRLHILKTELQMHNYSGVNHRLNNYGGHLPPARRQINDKQVKVKLKDDTATVARSE